MKENQPKIIFGYESPERSDAFESAAARAWNYRMENGQIVIKTEDVSPKQLSDYNMHEDIDRIVARIDVPQNLIDQMNS